MDHAEVLQRLEAAVASPGHLLALDLDDSAEGVELREHLATCQGCASEREAWRSVEDGLAAAAPDTLTASPAARDRILASVLAAGVARGPDLVLTVPQATTAGVPVADGAVAGVPVAGVPVAGAPVVRDMAAVPASQPAPASVGPQAAASLAVLPGGRSSSAAGRSRSDAQAQAGPHGLPFRWLALAAAATVLLFVAGALLGGPLGLTPQTDTATVDQLARVVAAAGDVLAEPGHAVAALQTADGSPGGAVLASTTTGELVVMSSVLPPLDNGRRYACLLVRDGTRTKVGYMHFSGDVAYWAGPVKDPADPGQPGDEFVVVPEDAVTQPPTLSGTF